MTCTRTTGTVPFTLIRIGSAFFAANRKFEKLISYLTLANPVPSGTVMLTGTGIIVTQEAKLLPGDVVTITVDQIGELSNTAVIV